MVTDGRKPQPRANSLQRGLAAKGRPVTKGLWTSQSQRDAWMVPLSVFLKLSLLGNDLKIPHCPPPRPNNPPTPQAKAIYIVCKLVSKQETARLGLPGAPAPGQLLWHRGAVGNRPRNWSELVSAIISGRWLEWARSREVPLTLGQN